MGKLQEYLISIRKEKNLSLRDAANLIGISHSYLSTLEKGIDPRTKAPVNPTPETLKLISSAYAVSYDYLMELVGYLETVASPNELSKKEKLNIEKEAEKMVENIDKMQTVEFFGQIADEDDKEYLKLAYEKFLTDVRIYNKQKYTPKKYKK